MIIDDPKHPGKHIDTETGIRPISEWGAECGRGLPERTTAEEEKPPSVMSRARRLHLPAKLNLAMIDVFAAHAFKNGKRAPKAAIRPAAGGIQDGPFVTTSWPNDAYGAIADPPYVYPGPRKDKP